MRQISKADIHIHTDASDGTANVRDVLRRAAMAGLRVVAITDHDTITGALEARRLAPLFGIEVIVGEEVSTANGHLLALFIEEALPAGRPAAETIAAVHAQGGLCIAPHPYDWAVPSLGKASLHRRCAGPRAGEWPLDAIEGINASTTWPAGIANRLGQHVGRGLGLPLVGGSDSHTLATVGRAYTLFPGTTAAELRRAIINGDTVAGGRSWTVAQTMEFCRLTMRHRGLFGAIALGVSNMSVPWNRIRGANRSLRPSSRPVVMPPLNVPAMEHQITINIAGGARQ